MARRKSNKKGVAEIAKTLRTRVIAGSWLVAVVAILYLIVRYISAYTAAQNAAEASAANLEQLTRVELPAGTANVPCAYKGFTAHFNPEYHIPNVVIYELTGTEARGTLPRYKNFMTDERVEGCATPWDYSYTGYDRGHMAPAGDMKWDEEAMRESFYMTNICPQAKALNTGAWNKLEGRVRDWAKRDSALIVATGPIMSADMPTIGESKVAVPGRFFKVVLAHRATPIRAIAFIYENTRCPGGPEKYAVSVDSVERATGIDFFAALPDEVEADVERRCDIVQWERRRN